MSQHVPLVFAIKRLAAWVPIFFSTVAMILSVIAYSTRERIPEFLSNRFEGTGERQPADLVRRLYESTPTTPSMMAHQAFDAIHREEKLRTLETVDIQERGLLCIVFVRYSIGTNVYRESHWFRKIDGLWFVIEYIFEMPDDLTSLDDQMWFETMKEKKRKWEDGSSSRRY